MRTSRDDCTGCSSNDQRLRCLLRQRNGRQEARQELRQISPPRAPAARPRLGNRTMPSLVSGAALVNIALHAPLIAPRVALPPRRFPSVCSLRFVLAGSCSGPIRGYLDHGLVVDGGRGGHPVQPDGRRRSVEPGAQPGKQPGAPPPPLQLCPRARPRPTAAPTSAPAPSRACVTAAKYFPLRDVCLRPPLFVLRLFLWL